MWWLRTLIILVALIAQAVVAQCAWKVNAEGTCEREWESSDLLRGPGAIVNAPLLPVRQMAGGAEYAWDKKEWRWFYTAVLGTAVTGVSGAFGMLEGAWWVVTGAADTLTGGYFEIAPERATTFGVTPELSQAFAGAPPTPTEDHCGRALVPAK